jgi:hypothetical protein
VEAQATMTIEQNKELARRFVEEVLNTGDFSTAGEYLAPDYVEHSAPPGMPANRQGVEMTFRILHDPFPDFNYVVDEAIGSCACRRAQPVALPGENPCMPES